MVELPHESKRLAALIELIKILLSKLGIVATEIESRNETSLSVHCLTSGVIVAARAADSTIDGSPATGDVGRAISAHWSRP